MLAVIDRTTEEVRASAFVRAAIARGQNFKNRLSDEVWNDFATYEGPEVSGNPEGKIPDNLEDDDNE